MQTRISNKNASWQNGVPWQAPHLAPPANMVDTRHNNPPYSRADHLGELAKSARFCCFLRLAKAAFGVGFEAIDRPLRRQWMLWVIACRCRCTLGKIPIAAGGHRCKRSSSLCPRRWCNYVFLDGDRSRRMSRKQPFWPPEKLASSAIHAVYLPARSRFPELPLMHSWGTRSEVFVGNLVDRSSCLRGSCFFTKATYFLPPFDAYPDVYAPSLALFGSGHRPLPASYAPWLYELMFSILIWSLTSGLRHSRTRWPPDSPRKHQNQKTVNTFF